jgi:hypothetical protein
VAGAVAPVPASTPASARAAVRDETVRRTTPAGSGSPLEWKIATFVALGLLLAVLAWAGVGRRIIGGVREARHKLERSVS